MKLRSEKAERLEKHPEMENAFLKLFAYFIDGCVKFLIPNRRMVGSKDS
jgi:hypothetical protein